MSDPDDQAPVRRARTVLYESPWVNLYRDRVALPTGRIVEQYHFLDLGRAVVVIVQDQEQRILLARVARYPTGTTTWELPAGGIEPGETALEAARREVLEETGHETAGHEEIYVYHPLNGISNQMASVVTCQAGERTGQVDLDEVCSIRWHSRDEIGDLLARREITDGFALVGLLLHFGRRNEDQPMTAEVGRS